MRLIIGKNRVSVAVSSCSSNLDTESTLLLNFEAYHGSKYFVIIVLARRWTPAEMFSQAGPGIRAFLISNNIARGACPMIRRWTC